MFYFNSTHIQEIYYAKIINYTTLLTLTGMKTDYEITIIAYLVLYTVNRSKNETLRQTV